MDATNHNQNKSSSGIWGAAFAVMLAISGVLGFLLFQEKQETDKQSTEISIKARDLAITHSKLDSISRELDAKIAQVQQLGGNIEELQKLKVQLEADKAAVLKNKNVSVAKYEKKIKEYEAILAQKDEDIARLQEENGQLTNQNQQLSQENTTIKTDLDNTRRSYSDSVSTLRTSNKELEDKVTIGSALRAENVRVLAVNKRGKERSNDENEYKGRKTEKIKVAFTLAPNPLTKEEPKDILLRVVDPEGAVLSDTETGSGVFSFQGKDMQYTYKQSVRYSTNRPIVEMLYTRGQDYKKGKYNIELYAEGFKIGEGNFVVR
jgi:prefoldin subunit 5